jgi:hypothetical protein
MAAQTKRAQSVEVKDLTLLGAKLAMAWEPFQPNAHHAMEKASSLG